MLTPKSDTVVGVELLDKGNRLLEAADAAAVIKAHDVEFGPGPTGRNAENGAAVAGGVEQGNLFGNVKRVVEWQDQHAGPSDMPSASAARRIRVSSGGNQAVDP